MAVEQTLNKNQHTKLTLEKKILLLLLPGFELTAFRSRVRHFYQQATLAPTPEVSTYSESLHLIFPSTDQE